MNPGGGACSELRPGHCTPARARESETPSQKKKKRKEKKKELWDITILSPLVSLRTRNHLKVQNSLVIVSTQKNPEYYNTPIVVCKLFIILNSKMKR